MAVYVLVDVDTQNAFASKDGNLSVYHPSVTPLVNSNIASLVQGFVNAKQPVVGCVDSHSYDAWEFAENGGPFPAHAVKGTADWLKVDGTLPPKFRFIPMQVGRGIVGENVKGAGNRPYPSEKFVEEVRAGIGVYFEKEVYSMFSNPCAAIYFEDLVATLEADGEEVIFVVCGYCTGGFCVDGAVNGLIARRYNVIVAVDATQAIDGANAEDGGAYSRARFKAQGCSLLTTKEVLELL